MDAHVVRAGTYEDNEEQHLVEIPSLGQIRFQNVSAFVVDQGSAAPPYAALSFGDFPDQFLVTDEKVIKALVEQLFKLEIPVDFDVNERYFNQFKFFDPLRAAHKFRQQGPEYSGFMLPAYKTHVW
tara:strand:- start:19 stop:396 length:378 start_codon:yes stop_codon:yes gene_type:complete